MDISIIKTISQQYKIVDSTDDNAPLVSFHNEFNKPEVVEVVFKAIVDYHVEQVLKIADIEKLEAVNMEE